MKMRTCRPTGRTHETNHLAFAHCSSGANSVRKLLQMRIPAQIGTVVFDIDDFAITTIPARFGDDAIPDRSDWCPAAGGKIYTGMGNSGFEHRMKPRFGK